ncbi:MAG: SGNH/GDSL hydrolase family protein [Candidatus Saccharimonadales bacterium]
MKKYTAFSFAKLLAISVVVGVVSVATVNASGQVDPSIRQSLSSGAQAARSTTERLPSSTQSATGQGQAANQSDSPADYIALGDSVAAGAGLASMSEATNVDEVCDRSSQAYPYQIAAALQTSVTHLACSGAKVDEGIYGTQARQGVRIPAQLDVAFAATQKPDIITVTIGANDARWTQFIRQCYIARCGTQLDEARAKLYRADLRIELTRMLSQIQTEAAGNPVRVFVSGYYDPFDSLDCVTSSRITAEELAWLKTQTANLNQAISSVTPLFSFATYVPVDFTGHELCSDDPWVQGIDAAAPVHPTASGQNAIARAFVRAM